MCSSDQMLSSLNLLHSPKGEEVPFWKTGRRMPPGRALGEPPGRKLRNSLRGYLAALVMATLGGQL